MMINSIILRIIFSLIIIIGVQSYGPASVYSQQGASDSNIQNLIVNGGFEGGFQEDFGIGYGWGGFSNGNAVVGWNFDDWDAVVTAGEYAQRIEIRDATELDRYAGIYQTISVVPGEQYKLTVKGLVRSSEGDISLSDYGYRLQYAIDYDGGPTWELVDEAEWKELPWDEQPMSDPPDGGFRHDSFETTITARSDQLTLFVRGWKKWINNGSGVYDLDEISFVGPAPEGFKAPVAAASVGTSNQQPADEVVAAAPEAQVSKDNGDVTVDLEQSQSQAISPQDEATGADASAEFVAPAESDASSQSKTTSQISIAPRANRSTEPESAPLPVSGRGRDDSIDYVVVVGATLLLVLIAGAFMATVRQRNLVE